MISILLNFCKLKRSVIQYSAQCINLVIFFPGMYFDFWCQKLTNWDFIKDEKFNVKTIFLKKEYGKFGIERDVCTSSKENKMCTVWQKSNILFYGEGGSKVNNERLQTPIWYNYRISEELLAEFYLMSTDFSKGVFKTLGWVGSYFCNTESAVIREGRNPVNFIENGQSDTYPLDTTG